VHKVLISPRHVLNVTLEVDHRLRGNNHTEDQVDHKLARKSAIKDPLLEWVQEEFFHNVHLPPSAAATSAHGVG